MIAYDVSSVLVGSAVMTIPTNPAKVAMIFARVMVSLRKMNASNNVNIGIVKLIVITVDNGNLPNEKQYIAIPADNKAARST